MSLACALLALGFLNGPADAKASAQASTSYRTAVYWMSGFDLRETMFADSDPVARRGNATIWVAKKATGELVKKRSSRSEAHSTIIAPAILVEDGQEGVIHLESTKTLKTSLARHADGPMNHASEVAYTPKDERIPETFDLKIHGRRMDQGMLITLCLDDHHIATTHAMVVAERVHSGDKSGEASSIKTTIEVPEISANHVDGEWMLKPDEVLIVSLGMCTDWSDPHAPKIVERVMVLTPSMDTNAKAKPESVTWRFPGSGARRGWSLCQTTFASGSFAIGPGRNSSRGRDADRAGADCRFVARKPTDARSKP